MKRVIIVLLLLICAFCSQALGLGGTRFDGLTILPTPNAWWAMDDNEPNATVRDSQDYSNGIFYDATGDSNTNAHSVEGKVNTALSFDGTDDYVDTNNTFTSVLVADCTFVFWFKKLPMTFSTTAFLAENDDISNILDFTLLEIGGTYNFEFTYGNSSGYVATPIFPVIFDVNEWNFVVVVIKQVGTEVYLIVYLNNKEVISVNTIMTMSVFDNTTANLLLGGYINIGTWFTGSIDDVRIYNKALAPNQVKSLHTLGKYNRKRFLLSADQLKL